MDFEAFVIEALKEIKEKQEATLVQTTKTNGRVTAIEKWQGFVNKLLWGGLCAAVAVIGGYIEIWISKH